MLVYHNGKKYDLTSQEIIDFVKKGQFSPDTKVEYKGKFHKLEDFKEIKVYFEESKVSTIESQNNQDSVSPPNAPPVIKKFQNNDAGGGWSLKKIVDKWHLFTKNSSEKITFGHLILAFLSGVLLSLASFVVLVFWITPNGNGKDNDKKHSDKALYQSVYSLMVKGEAKADSCSYLIYRVWYDTVNRKSDSLTNKYTMHNINAFGQGDFNYTIRQLQEDEDFMKSILEIETIEERVADLMKEIRNNSETSKDEEAYNLLLKQYQLFLKMTRLAKDPSGTLLEYGKSRTETDAEFDDNKRMLELYVE